MKYIPRYLLTSFLFWTIMPILFAQELELKKFDPEGVLGNVSAVIKDKKGFMWFGTTRNLFRYDGYSFKEFKHNLLDTLSLSNQNIHVIFEDSDGDLWIGTEGGLNKFCVSSTEEKFKHYFPIPLVEFDGKNVIKEIYEDREGIFWIGTGWYGLYTFDKTNEVFTELILDSTIERDKLERFPYFITSINEDLNGTLWVCTTIGLYKYKRDSKTFTSYKIQPDNIDHPSNEIHTILEDKSNNFWVGTGFGLYKFDKKKEKFQPQFLPEHEGLTKSTKDIIFKIEEDETGALWIRSSQGIYRYHPKNNVNQFWEVPNDNIRLTWDYFTFMKVLLVNSPDFIWLAAPNKTLYNLKKRSYFTCLTNVPDVPPGLKLETTTNILQDRSGTLWIGTQNGLYSYDRKRQKFRKYHHDRISGNSIHNLLEDRNGALWVGTWQKGLNKLVTNGPDIVDIQYHPIDPKHPKTNSIYELIECDNGDMMVSVGTDYFMYRNDTFLIMNDKANFHIIDTCLPAKIPGEVWNPTWYGPSRWIPPFTEDSNHVISPSLRIRYLHDPNDPESISCNRIIGQLISKYFQPATIWFTTYGGGLNKLITSPIKNSENCKVHFKRYLEKDGLPDNLLRCIEEDKNGNLWIGTVDGLSMFDPRTERFKNYSVNDGLLSNFINCATYLPNENGMMYLGTDKGLVSFYPDSIKENLNIPPVVITDFKLYNKSVKPGEDSFLKTPITYAQEINLPFDQNFIAFEFAALDFTKPEKNSYKYRLVGLNKDTIYAGNKHYAEYTDLKPGEYTFWVSGSNNDQVWNEKGTSLRISILPPWWRTKLAYAFYTIIIVSLIFTYIRWRTHQLLKEKMVLEKKVNERTLQIKAHQKEIEAQKIILEEKNKKILEIDRIKSRFFTNVSHEFRTPLSLILAPVEELQEGKSRSGKEYKKLSLIKRNAYRLLDLINQLLDISKIENGNMKQKLVHGDVLEKLHTISGSFSSLAEAKGINFKIHLPLVKKQNWFDPDMLEKIVTNLLSNAFKFTPEAGKVVLSAQYLSEGFNRASQTIEFSVSDTGPGIPADSLDKIFNLFYQTNETVKNETGGTGIGLSLAHDMVSLLHGEIDVKSEPGNGSRFTVRLPLGINHLNKNEYVIIDDKSIKNVESTQLPEEEISITEEKRAFQTDNEIPLILIVDDNRDLRDLIHEHLINYRIDEAIDGSAGLKKAFETIPDLIISDVMMPKMDGIELCDQLKNDERTSHIPIIMLTAKADLENKIEGLKTGADDYITKPFKIKELKARVENLIKLRKQLRERFIREVTLKPKDISITPVDERFLNRAIEIVEHHISYEQFSVGELYTEMGMSRSNFYRKLYALTNQAPSEFIRTIRLKRAAQLLEQNFGNVTEVAYEVGFNHLGYFSKCFKEMFGVVPHKYSPKSS
ncbi:hybrid sensor histidine kinase/response regulator transcription factor [Maribellus mangrovi]|uniref:hybrid sensor histidine kinase/response regulator transcription factor n=1 Tax=Maribellus mangrovi TaxID=3133146 RepID=UPI0030EC68DA